jgi:hypothetical protein
LLHSSKMTIGINDTNDTALMLCVVMLGVIKLNVVAPKEVFLSTDL